MSKLWSKIKEIDRRYPSSSIGTLVSIIFGIITLCVAIWYERQPQLRYEILGLWPVYSIREDVPDLVITFEGQNIRQQHQTLFVITMRVSNPGSASITLGSFDPRDLPGFEISEGKIIKLDAVDKSKKIEKTLQLTRTADNAYVINPLILDRDQFFVLKLLVLSPESSNPRVRSSGNVAGVNKIEVLTTPSPEEQRSVWSRAFYEKWPLQVLRGAGYTLCTLVVLVSFGALMTALSTAVQKRHRRSLVKKFRGLLDHEPTKKEIAIFDLYIESGESAVVHLNAAFSDRESLKKRVLEYLNSVDPNKPRVPARSDVYDDLMVDFLPWRGRFIPMLIEQKIINVENGNVILDEQTSATLTSFESFLLANEPEKIKTAKQPFGSDVHPFADVTSLPGTQKPENE